MSFDAVRLKHCAGIEKAERSVAARQIRCVENHVIALRASDAEIPGSRNRERRRTFAHADLLIKREATAYKIAAHNGSEEAIARKTSLGLIKAGPAWSSNG
jgi:hypothetical protein